MMDFDKKPGVTKFKYKKAEIAAAGNKPEDWRTYIEQIKKYINDSALDDKRKSSTSLFLYQTAFQAISTSDTSITHAKLLVEYAMLQSEQSYDDALKILLHCRKYLHMHAIVYVANAELELMYGHKDKADKILKRGILYKAMPDSLIREARYKLSQNFTSLACLLDGNKENQVYGHSSCNQLSSSGSSVELTAESSHPSLRNRHFSNEENLSVTFPGCKTDTEEVQHCLDAISHPAPPSGNTSMSLPHASSSFIAQFGDNASMSLGSSSNLQPGLFGSNQSSTDPSLQGQSSSTKESMECDMPMPPVLLPLPHSNPSSYTGMGKSSVVMDTIREAPGTDVKETQSANSFVQQSLRKVPSSIFKQKLVMLPPPQRIPVSQMSTSDSDESDGDDSKSQTRGNNSMSCIGANSLSRTTSGAFKRSLFNTPLVKKKSDLSLPPSEDVPTSRSVAMTPSIPPQQPPSTSVLQEQVNNNCPQQPVQQYQQPPLSNLSSKVAPLSSQPTKQTPEKPSSSGSSTYCVPVKTHGSETPFNNMASATKHNAQGQKIFHVGGKTYRVCKLLGRGGSAKVYQVQDQETACMKALKCVSLSGVNKDVLEGFKNEVALLQKLQHCDRVVKLYSSEYVESSQKLYLVMECGEKNLSEFIAENVKSKDEFYPSTVRYLWGQMLKAVHAMHKEGVIHSDLKPANFLLVGGTIKLIDFGIANAIQQDNTSVMKNFVVGTPNYMSPETLLNTDKEGKQAKSTFKIGTKSDVWSLGCILYQMVYGHTPFQHVRYKVEAIVNPQHEIPFPPLQDLALLDIMKKCLTRDVKLRPSTSELMKHPYPTLNSAIQTEAKPRNPVEKVIMLDDVSSYSPRTQEKYYIQKAEELQKMASSLLAKTGNNK